MQRLVQDLRTPLNPIQRVQMTPALVFHVCGRYPFTHIASGKQKPGASHVVRRTEPLVKGSYAVYPGIPSSEAERATWYVLYPIRYALADEP